jgi:hypothetical protein
MSTNETTDLVPTGQPAAEPIDEHRVLFQASLQIPTAGVGGYFGLSEPWDYRAPIETPEDYRERKSIGPDPEPHVHKRQVQDAIAARERGDTGYAILRTEEAQDQTSHATDAGDKWTWGILLVGCGLFLALMVLLIVLPHGRQASPPSIWLY